MSEPVEVLELRNSLAHEMWECSYANCYGLRKGIIDQQIANYQAVKALRDERATEPALDFQKQYVELVDALCSKSWMGRERHESVVGLAKRLRDTQLKLHPLAVTGPSSITFIIEQLRKERDQWKKRAEDAEQRTSKFEAERDNAVFRADLSLEQRQKAERHAGDLSLQRETLREERDALKKLLREIVDEHVSGKDLHRVRQRIRAAMAEPAQEKTK